MCARVKIRGEFFILAWCIWRPINEYICNLCFTIIYSIIWEINIFWTRATSAKWCWPFTFRDDSALDFGARQWAVTVLAMAIILYIHNWESSANVRMEAIFGYLNRVKLLRGTCDEWAGRLVMEHWSWKMCKNLLVPSFIWAVTRASPLNHSSILNPNILVMAYL